MEFSRQARILEWAAIPFSRDLPSPGIKPGSPTLQADPLSSEPLEVSKYYLYIYNKIFGDFILIKSDKVMGMKTPRQYFRKGNWQVYMFKHENEYHNQ